ncbi:helix-turn-helix domain-containing protein [Nocardia concava]|uniref:helix-turn-helix domain-containing protein n=1 Tax=Nocardia concava TaxID=257281 RepID=UPI0012F810B2
MALTEQEAKVLGILANSDVTAPFTVRGLSVATGLPESSIRRALLRLVRTGLAAVTPQSPARWQSTDRGRLAMCRPRYREYVGGPR